ncbi:uncharacterized protein PGRI_062420 [Penicillium griseofulvum]|uniref:G-protein coupled receptors family 2 profile 2 domain-containing protein n=1 Tax=Penicillium patulum TaxID=5078 RepID=A0A135LMT9_PENPA|nr:uncharacterized protein PGRI_062420 [Penicillium griseofulvum]KXG50275.1 hypothetical protein PGRI_062420 [Penicillium griseofulvum]
MVHALTGHCPSPFLEEALFPTDGGFIDGRYCETIPLGNSSLSCCLPCPLAEWRYETDLADKIAVTSWISVAILPLCVFLLVSYAVLPVKWSHRHYLSVCFTVGICFMQVAFIIPLGAKPEECHNAITPNDMRSNLSCAFSGSLLLFGGLFIVVWSFIRTMAFHLQVCWEKVLGPKFMWTAFVCGFGLPAIGLTVMLILTGVSFRFGKVCHINVKNGIYTYWIPVMIFGAAALILQLSTMIYCMHIYLRSLFDKSTSTTGSSGALPSYTSSMGTVTARQAYRRVRRVLKLQWRGIALTCIILGNVIFFAVVFINLDNAVAPTEDNVKLAMPWLLCLAKTGDKELCREYAEAIGPNEATVLAVVILLSLVGLWNFLLFARPSMLAGWLDLIRSKTTRRNEFVSVDAANRFTDNKGFEMLTSPLKSPDPFMRSPSPTRMGPDRNAFMRSPSPTQMGGTDRSAFMPSPSPTQTGTERSFFMPSLSPTQTGYGRSPASPTPSSDRTHVGREARYVRPSLSFSGPRPPSSLHSARDWDPQSSFAPAYGRGS